MDAPAPKSPPGVDAGRRCSCGCPCCGTSSPRRLTRRRAGLVEPMPLPMEEQEEEARSEVEGEVASLRKMIQDLWVELEEEQNAAATAANEAMSMILRLQREKAIVEMESRQFQRLAEERMAHDQREIAALEELLQAYKNRLQPTSDATSGDVIPAPVVVDDAGNGDGRTITAVDGVQYPILRCALSAYDDDWDSNIRFTPPRTSEIDATPSTRAIVIRRSYGDGDSTNAEEWEIDSFPAATGSGEEDESGDRVYTIDTVQRGATMVDVDGGNGELWRMRRVELRLAALEQDRNEIRKAVASMRSDIGQVVGLKRVAQRLCKILEHI